MLFASDLPPIFFRVFAFAFGALWGSFFNVAIYRWPRFLSVVSPASHCPACKKPIPFWRNVPLLGFILLRGKAACCGAKMSARYFVVELLGAVIGLALAELYIVRAPSETLLTTAALEAFFYFVFAGGLIVASFVDLEWMEIPEEVWLPGAAIGLLSAGMRTDPGPLDCAIGAGAGFLVVELLFVWGYERLTGRRGMGGGDPKLLMMIGAFLGYRGALFALVAGAFQGLIAAAIATATGARITPKPPVGERPPEHEHPEDDEDEEEEGQQAASGADAPRGQLKVPFGPFLALGAIEFLFFGEKLVELYLSLFAPE